jgi:hypothetical protein
MCLTGAVLDGCLGRETASTARLCNSGRERSTLHNATVDATLSNKLRILRKGDTCRDIISWFLYNWRVASFHVKCCITSQRWYAGPVTYPQDVGRFSSVGPITGSPDPCGFVSCYQCLKVALLRMSYCGHRGRPTSVSPRARAEETFRRYFSFPTTFSKDKSVVLK